MRAGGVTPVARRAQIVQAYRASGLTMAAFAAGADRLRDVHELGGGGPKAGGEAADGVC